MPSPTVFYFPIGAMSNDRIKLVPFQSDLHSTAFIAQSWDHPALFAHMPSGPFDTVGELKSLITQPDSILSSSNPSSFLFAIIDKTRPPSPEDEEGELAGMIAYINTSRAMLSTEIGVVTVLPKYQRTHVTSNAVGLLMQYALTSPEDGGLGLARTEWKCSTANLASAKVAERMGYEKVGVIPYHFYFPLGRRMAKVGNGKALPPGSDADDLWRDTVVYTMSWDLWEQSGREKVEAAMSR